MTCFASALVIAAASAITMVRSIGSPGSTLLADDVCSGDSANPACTYLLQAKAGKLDAGGEVASDADLRRKIEQVKQHLLTNTSVGDFVTGFVKYVGYVGNLTVSGTIDVQEVFHSRGQALSWVLFGTDPKCSSGGDPSVNGNSCGIHIHEGTSCTEAAGDHFYNRGVFGVNYPDPWSAVRYQYGSGMSESAVGFNALVYTGLAMEDVRGHAVVVHDFSGVRVACAILNFPR